MSKLMTNILLVLTISSMLVSCGGSKKKKVKEADAATDTSQERNNKPDAPRNSSVRSAHQVETAEVKSRIKKYKENSAYTYKVFVISRSRDIGSHRVMYFPGITDSRTEADQQDRWYWISAHGQNIEEAENFAYRIYPSSEESSVTSFAFNLAPDKDQQISEVIAANNGTSLELLEGGESLEIQCGNVIETYNAGSMENVHQIRYHKLTEDEEYHADFESPCSIYGFGTIETGIIDEDQDSGNGESAPTETAPVETAPAEHTCHTTHLIKIRIHGYCEAGVCHTNVTQIGEGTPSHSCPVEPAPPVCKDEQEHSCPQPTEPTPVVEIDHNNDPHQNLSDNILAFCSHSKQRKYFNRLEQVQSLKDELSSLASYCTARADNDEHCKSIKIHKLQGRLEKKYKGMHKILKSCQRRKAKDVAKGKHSNPEINTCGIHRRSLLKTHRLQVNKYASKVDHLEAICKTGGKCRTKKIERISRRSEERSKAIKKLETKCRVNK